MTVRVSAFFLSLGLLGLLTTSSPAAGIFPDHNGDGAITLADLTYFVQQFKLAHQGGGWSADCDLAFDKTLDREDAAIMLGAYLTNPPRPGRYVAFSSSRAGGVGGLDVYVYDRTAGSYLSVSGLNGTTGDYVDGMTPDGRYISLWSLRSGGAGATDVYLFDRTAGSYVTLPGLNTSHQEANAKLSSDARYIAFDSNRSGTSQIYLYDRATGLLVDLPGLNSPSANDYCASISADGRFLAFASDRAGGPGGFNVYLYDRKTSSLLSLPGLNAASVDNGKYGCAMSPDGRLLAVTQGTGTVVLFDRATNGLVSLTGMYTTGNNWVSSISSDDRYLGFTSDHRGSGLRDGCIYDRTTSSVIVHPTSDSDPTGAAEFPRLN